MVLDAMAFSGIGTLAAPADWFDVANWTDLSGGADHIPTPADDVAIPGGVGVVSISGGRLAEVNSIVTVAGSTLIITSGPPQPSQLKIDNNPPTSGPPGFPLSPVPGSNYFGGSVIDAGLINLNSSGPGGTQAIFASGALIGPGDLNGNLDAGPNSSFTFAAGSTGEFTTGATLGTGSGSVIVSAAVQIDGTLQDNTMTMVLSGGLLSGPTATTGALDEYAIFSWLSGTLALGGGTTIEGSGELLASGAGAKALAGTLTNMSPLSRLDGGAPLSLGAPGIGPGTLISATGTLEISLPAITGVPGSLFSNLPLGTIQATSPASAPTVISAPFLNDGLLSVTSGAGLVLSNTAMGAAPDVLDGVFQLMGNVTLLGAFTSVNGFMLDSGPGFLEVGNPGGGGGTAVLTVPVGAIDTLEGNLEVNTFSTLTGGGEVDNPGYLQLDLSSSTVGLASYVQRSSGTLALAVGGGFGAPAALTVTGPAQMSGTLVLLGYTPMVGKSFKVVTAGAVSGHFDTIPDGMSETDTSTSITVTQVRPPA
ncbi:MAG TPA: hypothetical protein VH643_03255 [Gemmataceae bacterium]